MRLLTTIKRPG